MGFAPLCENLSAIYTRFNSIQYTISTHINKTIFILILDLFYYFKASRYPALKPRLYPLR